MKLHIDCIQWRIQDFPNYREPQEGRGGCVNILFAHIFAENETNYRPHQDRLWHKLPAAQPTSGSLDLKWSVHICGRLGILRLTTSQFVFTQYIHHVRRPCMKFYFLFSQTRLAGVFYRSYLVKAVASPSTVRRTHAHKACLCAYKDAFTNVWRMLTKPLWGSLEATHPKNTFSFDFRGYVFVGLMIDIAVCQWNFLLRSHRRCGGANCTADWKKFNLLELVVRQCHRHKQKGNLSCRVFLAILFLHVHCNDSKKRELLIDSCF